jgi:superfamily I DNA and/or RNA helicase
MSAMVNSRAMIKVSRFAILPMFLIVFSHGNYASQNLAEVEVALKIAEQLQIQGKNFRIITPYDAQRSALEEGMKKHELNWEDKCFNVDSFQGQISISHYGSRVIVYTLIGNEDDYIIISTVRSYELGFLDNLRRTNVMLTRCKRGMFICSSKAYLERDGAQSLVGALAAEFGKGWVDLKDLEKVLLQL